MPRGREEERRSYVILRPDNFLVHTAPITREEAKWVMFFVCLEIRDRGLRARCLANWGNVLDVEDCAEPYHEMLVRLPPGELVPAIRDIYRRPEDFMKRLAKALRYDLLTPQARQGLEALASRAEGFLRKPVEGPQPDRLVVRYAEMLRAHLVIDVRGRVRRATPRPEWYAYKRIPDMYGISVFKGSFWLWRQSGSYVWAVMVKRDADDEELIDAVLRDEAVQGFLRGSAGHLEEVVREHEEEMVSRGYDDVVRKAKIALGATALLSAGRHEEEALPA